MNITDIRKTVDQLWEEVIGKAPNETQNFIEAGGNSISALVLTSKINTSLGLSLSPLILLETESISELASEIWVVLNDAPLEAGPNDHQVERPVNVVTSLLQQRWFYLSRQALGNVEFFVRVTGVIDQALFAKAVSTVIERHDVLRSSYVEHSGTVRQIVSSNVEPKVVLRNLTGRRHEEQRQALQAAIERSSRSFDIEREVPFELELISTSQHEHFIIGHAHHIAFDGWSIGILIDELESFMAASGQSGNGRAIERPAQYSDFALRQRQYVDSDLVEDARVHYRQLFEGVMKASRPPRNVAVHLQSDKLLRSSYAYRVLDAELSGLVRKVASTRRLTVFSLLAGAFARHLSVISGEESVLFGMSNAGRHGPAEDKMIGVFVGPMPVHFPAGVISSNELVARLAMERTLDFGRFEPYPLSDLMTTVKPFNSWSDAPFYVHVVYQNHLPNIVRASTRTYEAFDFQDISRPLPFDLDSPPSTVLRDLEVVIFDRPDGRISINFGFNPAYYEQAEVERWVHDYEARIAQLVYALANGEA